MWLWLFVYYRHHVKRIQWKFAKIKNRNADLVCFHKQFWANEPADIHFIGGLTWCRLRGCVLRGFLEVNKPRGKKTERGLQEGLPAGQVVIVVACQLFAQSRQWKQLISHMMWMFATSQFIWQICFQHRKRGREWLCRFHEKCSCDVPQNALSDLQESVHHPACDTAMLYSDRRKKGETLSEGSLLSANPTALSHVHFDYDMNIFDLNILFFLSFSFTFEWL